MGTVASTLVHASRLAILVALVAWGDPGLAQEQHLKVLGRGTWRLRTVDEVGDLDRDGVADLVVGAVTGGIPGSGIVGGIVGVVSGHDGAWMRARRFHEADNTIAIHVNTVPCQLGMDAQTAVRAAAGLVDRADLVQKVGVLGLPCCRPLPGAGRVPAAARDS